MVDVARTCERYLAHLKCILPTGQHEQTRKVVDAFLAKDGQASHLQSLLLQFAQKSANWVSYLFIRPLMSQK